MSPSIEVRRFGRADRDQLTALVNAHIGAVVPNVSVSVQGLLSHLERDPGEYVVDPWVIERVTLVAVCRDRIVAGAHLLRYAADERVGATLRDAGEVRWIVVRPESPEAGEMLLAACLAQFVRWRVTKRLADVARLPEGQVVGSPSSPVRSGVSAFDQAVRTRNVDHPDGHQFACHLEPALRLVAHVPAADHGHEKESARPSLTERLSNGCSPGACENRFSGVRIGYGRGLA